ncbi:MAG: Hsp20/alpha crystallin family protein [Candidatus Paceibacterota bacterium]|jgi:HSP20 family protein|nr:Hsp20/alpha crystallin family protein [Candidatus Paceibacterota bacterium]
MNSFLRKLKREGVVKQEEVAEQHLPTAQSSANAGMVPPGVSQLPVDVYQTDQHIVIYAQIPGLDLGKLDISIEGDNDVVTIQGEYKRPEDVAHNGLGKGEFSLEECSWGQFFRQIILPQEIDAAKAEAKVKDGVLFLSLPLKGVAAKKFKMRVVKIGEHIEPQPETLVTNIAAMSPVVIA